jgi:hypothetical protein
MNIRTIFLVPAILLMVAVIPTIPVNASSSNDEGPGNAGSDVSCDPTTGNPFQEKCNEKPPIHTGYARRVS